MFEYTKVLELMNKKGVSAAQLARDTEISPVLLTQWKQGRQIPSLDYATKIADYFNVSVDYLLGREGKLPSNAMPLGRMINMSVIGSISAGYDGVAFEDVIDEYPVVKKAFKGYAARECFVLKIKGNSMFPNFHEGDYVLVHKQESVDSGDIAIVLYNGDEATIKKIEYKKGEDWMRLVPTNPEYMPKTISGEDLNECHILGKVLTIVYRENL